MIPKGSNIISSMDSMHKNADLYPDPEKFIPERFMKNLKTMQSAANGKLEERDHFNFGWGRYFFFIHKAFLIFKTHVFNSFI